ncbi:serine/threonine-protein kinase [Kitasatospora sp. NPDC048365]|uniref:serine/threonine-protein kinase n=1 Tax=Kitasatospora sp. NPDC048365 TaxID=3364050 RepID=UPI0037151B88
MGFQDQSTGRVLAGRYALGERLGRGGMGTVWRARDEMLDREVAVKELTVSHLSEEDLEILQSRMKREARAAARIKHPGVITIHDVVEQDGRPWIVMELVDGRPLSAVVSEDGALSPREAAEVGVQVLAALHRGHQLGVLHRDVKPANVLLEHGTGRVVLLDFGIAKFEGAGIELTRPGDLVGSPDYLAPERAQGHRPGPASDLWALGATLYTAVEGTSPFRRDTPLGTLAAVVDEPLPESHRAGALAPVLAALMGKDPAGRPGADEALRMLREVAAGATLGIRASGPGPAEPSRVPTQYVPVVDRVDPPAAGPAADGAASPTAATAPAVPAVPGVPGVPGAPGAPGAPGVPAGPGAPGATAAALPGAPTEQVPAVGPRPARRRRRLPVLLGGALVLALVAGGGAWAVLQNRAEGPGGDPNPSVTAVDPIASGDPAPAGWTWRDDVEGFRFLLPTDQQWLRTEENGQVYYSPDAKVHYLQFAVTVGQPLTPREHFKEMETAVSKSLKDYQSLSMSAARINDREGAVWEFSYTAKDGSRRRAKEAEFRDTDGTSYAVYISGPEKDWTALQRRFTTVLNSFAPTR